MTTISRRNILERGALGAAALALNGARRSARMTVA